MKLLTTIKHILLDKVDDFIAFKVKGETYDPKSMKHLRWRRSGFRKGDLLVFNSLSPKFSTGVTLVGEQGNGKKTHTLFGPDDGPILYLGYREETILEDHPYSSYSTVYSPRVKHYFLNEDGIEIFYSYRHKIDVYQDECRHLNQWDLRPHFRKYEPPKKRL